MENDETNSCKSFRMDYFHFSDNNSMAIRNTEEPSSFEPETQLIRNLINSNLSLTWTRFYLPWIRPHFSTYLLSLNLKSPLTWTISFFVDSNAIFSMTSEDNDQEY